MNRIHWGTLGIFSLVLLSPVIASIAWDVWLIGNHESGSSISWSMSLLGRYPILIFAIGHVTGGILWGLATHFWGGMISPSEADELYAYRKADSKRKD